MNRKFLYLVTRGAISSSNASEHTLIGVNVSTTGSGSINGKTNFRGFVVPWASSPTQRGFLPAYTYYAAYGLGGYSTSDYYHYSHYAPGGTQGAGLQVSSTSNGWVFFASHLQYSGPTTGASSSYGGPINSTYYYDMYYGAQVHVFDPNVGGQIQNLTTSVWSLTASTSYTYDYRQIGYIEVADDGKQIAFVHQSSSSSYSAYSYYEYFDQLGYVGNINLSPTSGVLTTTPFFRDVMLASGSSWPNYSSWYRFGAAMTHYSLGGKVFAARTGPGYPSTIPDEVTARIYSYSPTASSGGEVDLGLPQKRYNVLNASR
jgi:hypothetical protein